MGAPTSDLLALGVPSPTDVLFWTGAGISVDAPTNGPDGVGLTRETLLEFLPDGELELLAELYGQLALPRRVPRLETVLDVLFDRYGDTGLRTALRRLADAPPNSNHRFFAKHLDEGGTHLTANFDTCIERVAARDRSPFHFHGTLSDGDLSGLGARLSHVENGFMPEVAAQLRRILQRADWIVVGGYSGTDFFDMRPFFLSLESELNAKTFLWHTFDATADLTLTIESAESLASVQDPSQSYLMHAARMGAIVVRSNGRLTDLLDAFAAAWEWRIPSEDSRDRTMKDPVETGPQERLANRIALHSKMGIRKTVLEHLSPADALDAGELEALADAYWGAGRYRAARGVWDRRWSGDAEQLMVKREERRCAVMWVRGDYVRAAIHTRRLLDNAALPNVPVQLQLEVADLYCWVLDHWARTPLGRLIISSRMRAVALERLDAARIAGQSAAGLQLRLRADSAAHALGAGRDAESLESSITSFDEAEALHAVLNFRQSRARARSDWEPAERRSFLVSLRDAHLELGAIGDAARVPLSPGGQEVFTMSEVWKLTARVDYTWLQSMRFLVHFGVRRLRYVLTVGR